jgi:hypothetical protein
MISLKRGKNIRQPRTFTKNMAALFLILIQAMKARLRIIKLNIILMAFVFETERKII